jgi:hypothetical protein
MVRILTSGGQTATGHAQPGVPLGRKSYSGFLRRNFKESVRRLSKRDPVDGILSTPLTDVYAIHTGLAALTTNLSGTNNDLVFTARAQGSPGAAVSIEYLNPGTANQSLAITVTGYAISISLATDATPVVTTTAAQISALIANSPAARALVTVANAAGNDGTGVVTAMTKTFLVASADFIRANLPSELQPGPDSPTVTTREEQTVTPKATTIWTTTQRIRRRSPNRGLRSR